VKDCHNIECLVLLLGEQLSFLDRKLQTYEAKHCFLICVCEMFVKRR
jgi:hypothetical protein